MNTVTTMPCRLPVIGHGLPLLRRPLRFVTSLRDRGEVVRIHLGGVPAYVVTTPELTQRVLTGAAGEFTRDDVSDAVRAMFGRAVATLAGEEHLRRRRQLAPALRAARIRQHVPTMADLADQRARSWRPGDRIAVDAELFELSLATLSTTLLGADLAPAAVAEIRRSLPVALAEIPRRLLLPRRLRQLPTAANRRFVTAAFRLRRVFRSVVAQRRAAGAGAGDLLSALVFEAGLCDDEAVDELVGLLVAGVDTPAAAVGWVCHELGAHPEVEARLHAELDTVLGDGRVTVDRVAALPVTNAVIMEALRKYPAWINLLQAATEVDLGAVRLPPGSTVAVSPYLLHHDPSRFSWPETFDPDRSFAGSLPFSTGVRKCPGEGFALTEMAVQVATIARRWRLRPTGPVRPVTRGVVVHADRLTMIAHAR
ncbi:cytochrome P450 [Kutzneria sp. 744]|uniref:cytochrome P450 n=1 Tax=Kutzneria sp. (strain 744) TaxID=345341 RepID=UPI0003EECBDE|nr:cytochrome P450 [Kutzneria sp. 744]EWM13638.1 cytochrome P450 hydroxylase [Kutzneria sp. 744]